MSFTRLQTMPFDSYTHTHTPFKRNIAKANVNQIEVQFAD